MGFKWHTLTLMRGKGSIGTPKGLTTKTLVSFWIRHDIFVVKFSAVDTCTAGVALFLAQKNHVTRRVEISDRDWDAAFVSCSLLPPQDNAPLKKVLWCLHR